jgi:uncharacterized protein
MAWEGESMIVSADRIYLILGNSCNMNCRYCLQHSLVEREKEVKYNPMLIGWLKRMAEVSEYGLRITFWGGEPLVYFSTIQRIMAELKGSNLKYSIVTNGKALTDEMVTFLNEHDVEVAISWDGKNTKRTRRFDVFTDEKLKQRIFALHNLCITGVVSSMAYPLDLLRDMDVLLKEYEGIHGRVPNINLDFIFDTGIPDRTLLDIDMGKMAEQARCIAQSLRKSVVEEQDVSKALLIFAYQVVMKTHSYYNKSVDATGCGNGYNVLNVDTNGTLYTCHNCRDAVGSVDMRYATYIHRIVDKDPVIDRLKVQCKDCQALPVCRGGCKLVADTGPFCQLRKTFYGAFYDELMVWGADLMKGSVADAQK